MDARLNFRDFSKEVAQQSQNQNLLPIIEKELLHYEILAAMNREGLNDALVFQGGTCLRLCYGSPRYSEDLDFSGGADPDLSMLFHLREVVEAAIIRRYKVEVTVREPTLLKMGEGEGISVERWQVQVVTAPGRPDIPQQRIKIEVASVPSHTKVVRPLIQNYSELADGYSDVLYYCESQEEICADKLLSLAAPDYVRHRDIWDLRWLARRPHFDDSKLADLLAAKIIDYHLDDSFYDKARDLCERLPNLIESEQFASQMKRFLPTSTIEQTINRKMFRTHMVDEISRLYEKVL